MAATATTGEDVMRGVAGGVILGVPLLYTQETWLHGGSVSPLVILGGVIAAFGVNVALSYFVGFRPGRTHRPIEDAVVGMGISVVLSALLLALLDRIGSGDVAGERARHHRAHLDTGEHRLLRRGGARAARRSRVIGGIRAACVGTC